MKNNKFLMGILALALLTPFSFSMNQATKAAPCMAEGQVNERYRELTGETNFGSGNKFLIALKDLDNQNRVQVMSNEAYNANDNNVLRQGLKLAAIAPHNDGTITLQGNALNYALIFTRTYDESYHQYFYKISDRSDEPSYLTIGKSDSKNACTFFSDVESLFKIEYSQSGYSIKMMHCFSGISDNLNCMTDMWNGSKFISNDMPSYYFGLYQLDEYEITDSETLIEKLSTSGNYVLGNNISVNLTSDLTLGVGNSFNLRLDGNNITFKGSNNINLRYTRFKFYGNSQNNEYIDFGNNLVTLSNSVKLDFETLSIKKVKFNVTSSTALTLGKGAILDGEELNTHEVLTSGTEEQIITILGGTLNIAGGTIKNFGYLKRPVYFGNARGSLVNMTGGLITNCYYGISNFGPTNGSNTEGTFGCDFSMTGGAITNCVSAADFREHINNIAVTIGGTAQIYENTQVNLEVNIVPGWDRSHFASLGFATGPGAPKKGMRVYLVYGNRDNFRDKNFFDKKVIKYNEIHGQCLLYCEKDGVVETAPYDTKMSEVGQNATATLMSGGSLTILLVILAVVVLTAGIAFVYLYLKNKKNFKK